MLVFTVGGAVLSMVAWSTAVGEWRAEPGSTSDESARGPEELVVGLEEQGVLSPALTFPLAGPGVAGFPASFLLAVVICLFNRPKFLVPPALRAGRGLLGRRQTSP